MVPDLNSPPGQSLFTYFRNLFLSPTNIVYNVPPIGT